MAEQPNKSSQSASLFRQCTYFDGSPMNCARVLEAEMETLKGRFKTKKFIKSEGKPGETTEIKLLQKGLHILPGSKPVLISVQTGVLFVTQETDPHDYILNPGEQLALQRKGKIVIEAYFPSVFNHSAKGSH
jgi:hypothetical protein